jgi:hypothetical protein
MNNIEEFCKNQFGKLCFLKEELPFFELSNYPPGYSMQNLLYLKPNTMLLIVGGKEFYKNHCKSHGFSIIKALEQYFSGTTFVYLYGNKLYLGSQIISSSFDEYITIL